MYQGINIGLAIYKTLRTAGFAGTILATTVVGGKKLIESYQNNRYNQARETSTTAEPDHCTVFRGDNGRPEAIVRNYDGRTDIITFDRNRAPKRFSGRSR